MTSQIEKGLQNCPFCGSGFVAQGASGGYIAVWCGDCGARGPDVKFPENSDPRPPVEACRAAWNRRALTATGESKTESSPEVTEAMVEAFVEGYRRGMGRAVLREITFSEAETDGVRSAAFHYVHSLSVGREGAAQGRDAVRVKALLDARPLTLVLHDDGLPEWRQILLLFDRFHLPHPPTRLRDELVTILSWARYGESLLAALDTSPEGMVEERI